MVTFPTQGPPQPGEGRWLTQTINQNVSNGRQRGRQAHPKMLSFLPQRVDSVYEEDAAEPRDIGTWLDTEGNIEMIDNGQGISHNTFLASPGAAACDTTDHFTSFLHHPPPPIRHQPYYTTMPAPDTIRSDALMTSKNTVPPHLKAKKAVESRSVSDKVPSADVLREKLSAHGVKVSSPKQVAMSSNTKFEDLLATQETKPATTSQTSDQGRGAHRRGQGRSGGRGGRGRGHPHINDSFVRAQNDGWANNEVTTNGPKRSCGEQHQPARNSQWASRKDFPKPPPDRYAIKWDGNTKHSWDSSTIDSGRASSGWGTRQKRREARQSGVPLGGYDGKFAPPPVDWDSRPGFREGQSYQQIMQWMTGIESMLCGIDRRVPLADVTAENGVPYVFSLSEFEGNEKVKQMGEIVPLHWVPISLGRKAPHSFWNDILAEPEPAPCDPGDLVGMRPWWEKLVKKDLDFMEIPDAPAELGIDPDEEDADQALKRKHDMGSLTHAENRKQFELERIQAKLAKQQKKAAKEARLTAEADQYQDHRRIKTGGNIFVRAATKHDMDAITHIYNFYITQTVSVPELDPRTKAQMQQRRTDVRLNRMPYLVACIRGGVLKASRKKRPSKRNMRTEDEDIILPDTVVGFAFADDFNDLKGMYRFTAEVEVYVHNDHYQKGVAKCLLDKLTGLLDSHYLERGGYESVGDDIDGTGEQRVVKNIIMHLSYDRPEKLEWVGKWLEGWLGFKQVGNLVDVGTKNGKAVSMAIFQRETGEPLNHSNPPIMMEYPTTSG